MNRFIEGLDKSAIHYALFQTVRRALIATTITVIISIALMLHMMGYIHPVGIASAIVAPLLLGTPSALVLYLQNQKLRVANQRLKKQSSTDWLTGALNRRAFTESVNLHLAQDNQFSDQPPGALLVIDVDRFKAVNDTYGHEAGDIALQIIVETIQNLTAPEHPVGRIGGEEFSIFLPGADATEAVEVATNVRKAVNSTDYSRAGLETALSISIGVALADATTDLQQLYRIADTLLYQAKDEGRNRVVFDAPDILSAKIG